MRPVSPKTQAVRDLLDKNPATTWGDAKPGLIKAKLFEDNDADESYFNNVKSQYLKRQTAKPAKKTRTVVARPKVSRPTTPALALADAVLVIQANGGNVTAARAKIAEITQAIEIVESNTATLTALAS